MTAIYFFTTNVLEGLVGDLTPEQREHLEFRLENVKQLKDMVSDLLDMSRVETHKLNVILSIQVGAELIAEVLSTCRTNAESKNISLRADVTPRLPSVWADRARVRQVLINLIDNGIKFTPEDGTVTVRGWLRRGGQRFSLPVGVRYGMRNQPGKPRVQSLIVWRR